MEFDSFCARQMCNRKLVAFSVIAPSRVPVPAIFMKFGQYYINGQPTYPMVSLSVPFNSSAFAHSSSTSQFTHTIFPFKNAVFD